MSFTITVNNSEFATATGSNVNARGTASIFDHPPDAATNLEILTGQEDDDPRLFEVGDSYELRWSGGHIAEAEVVRSDAAPGGGGIVVFEGKDDDGEVAQVIWTAGFDIDAWYASAAKTGGAPGFYTSDRQAKFTYEYMCFADTVGIATPRGQVPAGKIAPGDTVRTFSGEGAKVLWVARRELAGAGRAAPIRFAAGAFGNNRLLRLSPQHRVLVASPRAELAFGTPEVLVPAKALTCLPGIRRQERERIVYVHLLLDRHDILLAEGMGCESLLPTWRSREFLDTSDRKEIARITAGRRYTPARPLLSVKEAAWLLDSRAVCRAPTAPRSTSALLL